MPITVDAIYENDSLKLNEPLQLKEHEKVQITVRSAPERIPPVPAFDSQKAQEHVRASTGNIPCTDAAFIEHVALDPLEDL